MVQIKPGVSNTQPMIQQRRNGTPKIRGSTRLTSGIATVNAVTGIAPKSRARALEEGVGRMAAHLRHAMQQRPSYIGPLVVIGIVVIIGLWVGATYNSLVTLGQAVDAQWGQVQNVYQRRADLIPNLVATVKGAANFESSTYETVAKARASVGQISPQVVQNAVNNPQDFARYAQAQDALSSALSRLLAVVENYPQLKATENFQTLQAQLEGTENRIAFERRKYNDVARAFNTKRDTIPTVFIAGMFGSRFNEKPYFQAQPGAEKAPVVNFSP
jgi:LemA protein